VVPDVLDRFVVVHGVSLVTCKKLSIPGVRIAPAGKRDQDGSAVSGYRHIDWLDHAVMGDDDARRILIHRFPANPWPGQKGRRCPEHRFGGIAAKGGTGMVWRTAKTRHGDKTHQPESGPAVIPPFLAVARNGVS
jgi:hypothetical protein